jgi:hypothetical protein
MINKEESLNEVHINRETKTNADEFYNIGA